MKREFSGHILEKYSKTKFYENPASGSRVVHCGRTGGQTEDRQAGRHDKANSGFSQFCERV
jgi:hypothetical protein